MRITELLMKLTFYFWLTVGGITLTDFAMGLHDMTVAAYRKGPVSAAQFTQMMTKATPRRKPASKR